jgi:hypothetical protein
MCHFHPNSRSRDRVVKVLVSGTSWHGFESHRVQFFLLFFALKRFSSLNRRNGM